MHAELTLSLLKGLEAALVVTGPANFIRELLSILILGSGRLFLEWSLLLEAPITFLLLAREDDLSGRATVTDTIEG